MSIKWKKSTLGVWLAAALAVWCGVGVMTVDERSAAMAAEQFDAEVVPAPSPIGQPSFGFVGTASCAAANCHGGDASRPARAGTPPPDPLSPQAYSIWIQRDPHAWAYSTLLSPESRQMVARLGYDAPAHESQACLSCHSPLSQQELAAPRQFTPHDGVSCEACHGPAEKWLEPHKWDTWRSMSPAEKAADGFRDMADLVARAELCAECHVGSDGRDVNHDLIAAGHPRMRFEFSAYHANLPKHWSRDNFESPETIDAKLWQIGQIASADSALGLLQSRAASEAAPWPEFAEYDCFACHHELRDPSWRQERGFPHGAGAYPWGTWYFSLLPQAMSGGKPSTEMEQILQTLAAEMGQPSPNRDAVRQAAFDGRTILAGTLLEAAHDSMTRQEVLAMLRQLTEGIEPADLGGWDATSQRFLAASALYHAAAQLATGDADAPSGALQQIGRELETIRESLQFPSTADGTRYRSPRNFSGETRRVVAEAFATIHELLENWNRW